MPGGHQVVNGNLVQIWALQQHARGEPRRCVRCCRLGRRHASDCPSVPYTCPMHPRRGGDGRRRRRRGRSAESGRAADRRGCGAECRDADAGQEAEDAGEGQGAQGDLPGAEEPGRDGVHAIERLPDVDRLLMEGIRRQHPQATAAQVHRPRTAAHGRASVGAAQIRGRERAVVLRRAAADDGADQRREATLRPRHVILCRGQCRVARSFGTLARAIPRGEHRRVLGRVEALPHTLKAC
mmetsp:Transcript_162150/g.520010  ORF Transcript_162150/g.520010 Transcript_162150/m.520010 type:complete len:239 (+) Transcript_162150:939-1655(+)